MKHNHHGQALLDNWSKQELDYLFQMYVEDSKQSGVTPTMSDFLIFLEELI